MPTVTDPMLSPGDDEMDDDWLPAAVQEARDAGESIEAGLKLAMGLGARLPLPGSGQTARRWDILAAIAQADVTPARILEAHSDALAILAEAGLAAESGLWGVFAAEAPQAVVIATEVGGTWHLTGTKAWCSLAYCLDHALVTARTGQGTRRLFAVDLHDSSVDAAGPGEWLARGLRTVGSGPVQFAATPATPVGAPDWYLQRPGFAWGGMGVAACWAGGAMGLWQSLREYGESHRQDQLAMMLSAPPMWPCTVPVRYWRRAPGRWIVGWPTAVPVSC